MYRILIKENPRGNKENSRHQPSLTPLPSSAPPSHLPYTHRNMNTTRKRRKCKATHLPPLRPSQAHRQRCSPTPLVTTQATTGRPASND